ncbi:hypothetical protein F2Q68_00011504 [Brassica cretica]|uniref:Uncharacterized protein n=1 Tax=Brassica cretica TaxID=69181 RepID=A0A8S9KV86_BRACR|nr:hypothetical protein F2Q68_00011504 [Brassica cretica]
MDLLLSDRAKQEKVNYVGEQKQEETVVVHEVDGLEGQEELCFVNANGTWYKKEPNFQYNNYQQKPFYNNQQGGYQVRQNYSQGFSSKENQSTQGQTGSSTSAPEESSTDAMLKQILESQTRSEKHNGYELKNLHTKIDGSYNDLNNNFLYGTEFVSQAAAQIVDETEHKAMERVKAQAELKRNGNLSVVLKRPDAPALDDWSVERPTGTRYDTRSVPERPLAASEVLKRPDAPALDDWSVERPIGARYDTNLSSTTFESRSDQDGARSSTCAQYEEMKQRAGVTSRSEVRHPLWKQSDLVERLHQPARVSLLLIENLCFIWAFQVVD